jgi:glycosyltransferase involved in cell wall biosynthesis
MHLFTALRDQLILRRAFGADVSKAYRCWLLARNYHRHRKVWRKKYYFDISYRKALTRAVANMILDDDRRTPFLQIGAMFDLPSVAGCGSKTMSYHDGNILESLHSGYGMQGVPKKAIDQIIQYERDLAHRTNLILTMSEYLRQSFIHGFSLPKHRVVNVGGGLNYLSVPPIPSDKNYDSAELLFVGVEFERKGGKQLLQAFADVVQQIPRAKLHIVGPASVSVPQSLKNSVILHGFLSRSNPAEARKMNELFDRCPILILPSLYEPFGIAPLEAMARGSACIVTDAWALREMVRPGVNGELVERGSADELAFKIVRLLSAPDDIRRFGQAGREIVLAHYTWPKVAQRIHAAAESIS